MEKHDRFITIGRLVKILSNPLVIFDVGVRWGFQEHWTRLEPHVTLIGMDADEGEINELKKTTKDDEFVPRVLGAQKGIGKLYVAKDPACSSLYPPDDELIRNRPTNDTTKLAYVETVDVSTLDDYVKSKDIPAIDFIKLDVQGAELNVLKGANSALQDVRMLEVEVQFNPLYQGVPLFGDVDRFLRQQGFTLWRIKNFCHYEIAGINTKNSTEETVKYDYFTVHFNGRDGQVFWADAFYVRTETAFDTLNSWETALKDACMARALGFEDLYVMCIRKALKICPEHIAQQIRDAFDDQDPTLTYIETSEGSSTVGTPGDAEYVLTDLGKLRQIEAERDQAVQLVNALYSSHSYKVTAPLRFVTKLVRYLGKRQ